ncbi:hypothetical protein KS4_23890 [Poriferisphaera corsica]|uniref:Uncharacterized protein n=1 Tax=Poriferisphaera corsica TaxID=2528020 RepID=A0A517YVQ4_9BACT|nr:hypothetical protein [Poriferisphaera corsica]QDU34321.1 hypothetical protein KS4_23890 [Poriferisphaera corsica]
MSFPGYEVESMLKDTLQNLIDDRIVTRKEIASAAKTSTSTVDRWLNGDDLWATQVNLLLGCRSLPDKARIAIDQTIIRDTGFQSILGGRRIDGDVNGDGKIDHDDVLDGSIGAVDGVRKMLDESRESMRDGQIDNKELERIKGMANDLMETCKQVVTAAETCAVNRRKARQNTQKPRNGHSVTIN